MSLPSGGAKKGNLVRMRRGTFARLANELREQLGNPIRASVVLQELVIPMA